MAGEGCPRSFGRADRPLRQPCTMKAAATRSRRSAYAAIGAAVVVRRCRGADLSYRRADCSMPSPFDCCGRGRAASRRRAFFGCQRRRCLLQPDGAGPCSIDCGIRCIIVWTRRNRAHCLAGSFVAPKIEHAPERKCAHMFAISPARADQEPAPGTLHPAPEWEYDNQMGAGDQRLWSIREGLRNNTQL